jgi:ABC-2 type transport system permease protein
MTWALRMEWTKLRTVRTSVWSVAALVAFSLGLGALTVWSLGGPCPPACDAQLAVVVLAVLTVSVEYETTMIRTTFAAVPRRITVLAAKAAVLIGVVLATGAVTMLAMFVIGRAVMPDGYPPLSLADGPTLRAFGGTVLYLGLIALLGLGVATIVRHTAGGISLVLALLYIAPIVSLVVQNEHRRELLQRYSPMTAGLAIQATKGLDDLPIGPWAGLAVLAGYAAGALLIAAVLIRIRDA